MRGASARLLKRFQIYVALSSKSCGYRWSWDFIGRKVGGGNF